MGADTGSRSGVTALRIANGSAVSLQTTTEARDKGEAPMPQGKTQHSLDLLDTCYAILQEMQPASGRTLRCFWRLGILPPRRADLRRSPHMTGLAACLTAGIM